MHVMATGGEERRGEERRGETRTIALIFSDEEDAYGDDAGMWRSALWAIARAPRAQNRKRECGGKREHARVRVLWETQWGKCVVVWCGVVRWCGGRGVDFQLCYAS